jgi:hypothetical protein
VRSIWIKNAFREFVQKYLISLELIEHNFKDRALMLLMLKILNVVLSHFHAVGKYFGESSLYLPSLNS